MEAFLIVVISVIALAVLFYLANEFYKVAKEKGYYEKKYLWIAFLFSIIGYLLIIALPDRNQIKKEVSTNKTSEKQKSPDLFSTGAMDIPKRKRSNDEV